MKDKIRSIISTIFLFIGIFLLTSVVTFLILYLVNINKATTELTGLKEYIEEPIVEEEVDDTPTVRQRPDFSHLYETNNDFVGWITVEGTVIDYPVMQTKNDEQYYIRRNFEKTYDSSGVPFCNADSDVELPSDNIIIYGHHMKAGTMFAQLDKFKKQEFYNTYHKFTFDTLYRSGVYEIIAVVLTDAYPGSFPFWTVSDCTEEEFDEYVTWLKSKSVYTIDEINNTSYGDKLVTLSTCAYHTGEGRLLVVGRLVETDDEILMENCLHK